MTDRGLRSLPAHILVPSELAGRLTISVPEAGGYLGLSRNSAYDAAKRGDIPTIRLGRVIRVPVAGLLELVQVDPIGADPALTGPMTAI